PNAVVHGVVTEWLATDPHAEAFDGTRREILRLGFASYVHGIQQIDFNPTARPGDSDYGLLYIAVGDGGLGASSSVPQNRDVPFGKLLRVDPSAPAGAAPEIFAYGMRDPHRFSWDAGGRHRLLLAHIGERHVEAIYDVRKGDNPGWSEREGSMVFDRSAPCEPRPLPADDAKNGYVYPVAQYGHDAPAGYPCDADVG